MRYTATSILLFLAFQLPVGAQRVSGTVESPDGVPLSHSYVRIQGADQSVITDKDGRFSIQVPKLSPEVFLAAGHEGFYNNRVKTGSRQRIVIELRPIPAQDNVQYHVQDPTPDHSSPDNCGNCHTTVYNQWKVDGHSLSAIDPIVKTLYDGTDVQGRASRGPGYKLDWTDEGNCASCHAPVAILSRRKATNLDEIREVERAGIACDVCHKMKEIPAAISSPAFSDVQFLRPSTGIRLNFGPFEDSTFPGEIPDFSYSPLFKDSRLCAPCHDGKSWGVPIYETYTEWRSSIYSRIGTQCQGCHMASTGEYNRFADAEKGGKERNVSQIGVHQMMGSDSIAFLQRAAKLDSSATIEDGIVTVRVKVSNIGAGHDLPTGQPMRNVLLLVDAEGDIGTGLTFISGERVPSWGGTGSDPSDYAGHPGKGFAKVLETLNEYQKPTLITGLEEERAEFPAPAWRRTRILTDNRIPAMGNDTSAYLFVAPSHSGVIHVRTRLVYRKAFKPLADVKGWDMPDIVLVSNELTIPAVVNQKGN